MNRIYHSPGGIYIRILKQLAKLLKPSLAGDCIVIDKGDDITLGSQQADIPRLTQIRLRASQHAHSAIVLGQDLQRVISGGPDDDHHLKVRVCLLLQRTQ
jgi:hypothetical protein